MDYRVIADEVDDKILGNLVENKYFGAHLAHLLVLPVFAIE